MFGMFRKKCDAGTTITDARRLVSQGNISAALALYDQLISDHPGSSAAYADRGTALAMAGMTRRAILDLKKAIELGYTHASVYTSLATALMTEGDSTGALASFEMAARLDSTNALIYYNRASLLARMGDKSGAHRDLEHCLMLGPDSAFEQAIRRKLDALGSQV
jgi:Flp pilus assembly protein TadD